MKSIGMGNGNDLAVISYEETAEKLHNMGVTDRILSRQSVMRIEQAAMRKLRSSMALRDIFSQICNRKGGGDVYQTHTSNYAG